MTHLKTSFHRRSLLALALGLGMVGSAQAQQFDDRWEISGSYFRPNTELSLSGRGEATDGTETVSGSGSASISDDFRGDSLEATFRATNRQRIVLGWYRINSDRRYEKLAEGTYIDDQGDAYEYEVDAVGQLGTEFELYRLSYGFDVIQNEKLTVTALAGIYGAKLKSDIRTSGSVVVNDEGYDLFSHTPVRETHHAPGLGLSAEWRPTDKWNVRASVQGFKTQWGDFGSSKGHFGHAQAQVGYNFTPHWTAFAGYNWFEFEMEDEFSGATTYEGVDYSGSGEAKARIRVRGPEVGFRYKF